MDHSRRLIDLYLPPGEGYRLVSLIATTYQVDFEFLEEELLAEALGVRSPVRRVKAFRSELERALQTTDVSVLYDLRGCDQLARLSPRVDPIPIVSAKLHAKISLLMWVRQPTDDGSPDRLMRLIVGSANLTRQGFRQNYECVASVDFGGQSRSPRELLTTAIESVRQIAAESDSPQLQRQLADFENHAGRLPEGAYAPDDPLELVRGNAVLPRLKARWDETTTTRPDRLTIVSPFWPEGTGAAGALADVIDRFAAPDTVELVCRGVPAATGKGWLPEFDPTLAAGLKERLTGRLFLRPALPATSQDSSVTEDADVGDEQEQQELGRSVAPANTDAEDIHRPLHAKMILLDGPEASVLYIGSSNCTRRGLGLGGPVNREAGFIYRLTPKHRRQLFPLLAFAGPPVEVLPDKPPKTVKPEHEQDDPVPAFLSEVTAEGSRVTIRFRDGEPCPDNLVVLMQIPSLQSNDGYWLIHRHDSSSGQHPIIIRDLADCPRCDTNLLALPPDEDTGPFVAHVVVEVRWDGFSAEFPVRFDDKAKLPLLLVGRKPTEGELIEYFLFGHEPGDDDGDSGDGNGVATAKPDGPVDTRHILPYFVRRFVQAIPGLEAELQQAGYSRTALDAALRGPTSPLELAEQAFASLENDPPQGEPKKTPVAVGFQLTEILAALLRSQAEVQEEPLRECYVPVIGRCRELIDQLIMAHPQLAEGPFRVYHDRFVGGQV